MDSLTVSRSLEQTFKAVLSANPGLSGITIRTVNEDGARELPCVVLSARSTAKAEGVRVGGIAADECNLRAECMVHGGDAGSSAAIERLAESVQRGIETATGVTGWRLLVLDFDSIERGFDGQVRTVTLTWKATALAL